MYVNVIRISSETRRDGNEFFSAHSLLFLFLPHLSLDLSSIIKFFTCYIYIFTCWFRFHTRGFLFLIDHFKEIESL